MLSLSPMLMPPHILFSNRAPALMYRACWHALQAMLRHALLHAVPPFARYADFRAIAMPLITRFFFILLICLMPLPPLLSLAAKRLI